MSKNELDKKGADETSRMDIFALRGRIESALLQTRKERANKLYKKSQDEVLNDNEREILLFQACQILDGESDDPMQIVLTGAHEDLFFSNSIDKTRMDFFTIPSQYFKVRTVKTPSDVELLVPRIFLKQYFRIVYLRGQLVPGEIVHSVTLLPNQKARIPKTPHNKNILAEAQSFTHSSDTTILTKLDNQIQKEEGRHQIDSSQIKKYENTPQIYRIGGQGDYDSNLSKRPENISSSTSASMSGNRGINASFHKEYINNKDKGFSTDANFSREETHRILYAAQLSLLNEQKTQQPPFSTIEEEQDAKKTVNIPPTEEIQNPNRSSTIRIDFINLVRKIYACYLLYDVKIVFSDGIASIEIDIRDLKSLLDDVLVPDDKAPGIRQNIYDEVLKSCRVVDYENRIINLLEEGEKPPKIRSDGFFNLLSKTGSTPTPQDQLFTQCASCLKGVILAVDELFVPLTAITFISRITSSPLDKREIHDFDIELRKRLANAAFREKNEERTTQDLLILKSTLKFIEDFKPTNPEGMRIKEEMYFKLIQESRQVLDRLLERMSVK